MQRLWYIDGKTVYLTGACGLDSAFEGLCWAAKPDQFGLQVWHWTATPGPQGFRITLFDAHGSGRGKSRDFTATFNLGLEVASAMDM